MIEIAAGSYRSARLVKPELEQLKAALDDLNRDSPNVLKVVVSVLLP